MLDLLYDLMLESTGRLQKCRIYEMTDNKTARSTIAYLIVRDQAHENAFAKSVGEPWGELGRRSADPEDECRAVPRVKKLLDMGLQSIQYTLEPHDEEPGGALDEVHHPRTTALNSAPPSCRRFSDDHRARTARRVRSWFR